MLRNMFVKVSVLPFGWGKQEHGHLFFSFKVNLGGKVCENVVNKSTLCLVLSELANKSNDFIDLYKDTPEDLSTLLESSSERKAWDECGKVVHLFKRSIGGIRVLGSAERFIREENDTDEIIAQVAAVHGGAVEAGNA